MLLNYAGIDIDMETYVDTFLPKEDVYEKMAFVTGQTLVNIMLETQAILKEAGEHSYQL